MKNRVLRSSVAGRFDNYDGSGTEVRINWDVKFARGGVGAIISSNAPIHEHGHIVPGYAYLDSDERIPFWRELGRRVHEHDCKYIAQLVFAGRERILPGLRYDSSLGATNDSEPVNGFACRSMTAAQIREVTGQFVQAARRAREAGLDGIELAGANGMLFTQFLSPAINTRKDDYGGPLENRARLGARGGARGSRRGGRRLLPRLQDQRRRGAAGAPALAAPGQQRRGRRAGLPLARGGGCGLSARERGHGLPAPAQPCRPVPREGRRPDLRHAALERLAHAPQLPRLPHVAVQRGLPMVVGASEPPAGRGGDQPARRPGGQAARSRSRCSAPAASRRRR